MTRQLVAHAPPRPVSGAAALGVAGCAGYMTALMWAMGHTSYDVWGSMLLVPLLMAVSTPFLVQTARRDGQAGLLSLLLLALLLKLLSAVARYYMAYVLYGGASDAEAYHQAGAHLAELLRVGYYEQPPGRFPGTASISILTGAVYAVFGAAKLTGFFVFSWIGFWGLYLFFRAFRLAVPDGDSRRYALMVLFLPSLLFWPSSIGKEAAMTFSLGLAAYGAARLLSRNPGGVPLLALGLTGAALVRPHMAVLVFAGVFTAYLFRPSLRTKVLGPVAKLGMLVLMLGAGAVLLQQTQTFFGVEETSTQSFGDVVEATNAQTAQGGSAYEASPVRSPLDVPSAAVTVLFRPFPHEAGNSQALAASLEGAFLLVLVLSAHRRLRGLAPQLRRNPYVVFATTYTLLFVVAFSSFANFGILTRQRVQVYPFLLLLLALPKPCRPPRRQPLVHAGRRLLREETA